MPGELQTAQWAVRVYYLQPISKAADGQTSQVQAKRSTQPLQAEGLQRRRGDDHYASVRFRMPSVRVSSRKGTEPCNHYEGALLLCNRSQLASTNMHTNHAVESSKNSALTDELLTKEPAAAESTGPSSDRPATRKQTWKDFIAGCITGCGVAGV